MNERKIITALTYVCGIIVAVVLIGLWLYGVDLSTVFLGTSWKSSLTYGRGAIALEGAIVFVTILFGGLLVSGIMALLLTRVEKKTQPEQ
jgi:hypothetical protein